MVEARHQSGQALENGESPNRRAWLRFRDNRPAVMASLFLLILISLALAWPLISSQGDVHSEAQFAAPSGGHWFGTDVHGRDLFGRVLAGTRISLMVGLVGALVSLVIGVSWGATAGFLGGRWDNLLMRTVDVLYSLPSIIFVIVIITTLEGVLQRWLQATFGGDGGETTHAWVSSMAPHGVPVPCAAVSMERERLCVPLSKQKQKHRVSLKRKRSFLVI